MNSLVSLPAPHGDVAGKVHALWRFLERLADSWDYARETDLDLVDRMLGELGRGLNKTAADVLPSGTDDLLAAAQRAVERARTSHADARMRHLEAAGESLAALRLRLPADL